MTTTETLVGTERQLRQRVAANAADIEGWRQLGRVLGTQGRSKESAECYARILQKNNRDVEALSRVGHFYVENGAFEHALPLFRAVLLLDPKNAPAKQMLFLLHTATMAESAAKKTGELYEALMERSADATARGLVPEHVPILVEMNGDLVWLPGDLLRYLWHTVQKPLKSAVPSFLAETEHYVWVREKLSAGDTVFDIGSNIGIFATMMAAKVGVKGRVFAFEPSPRIASDLRRVLKLNALNQVTVTEAAVADKNGEAVFCEIVESDVRRESSHLNNLGVDRETAGLLQTATTVKTIVVDEFVAERGLRPALMKIDVEGAEFLVLEGARKTVAGSKPKLVIEFHVDKKTNVFDHDRLQSYLRQYGYQHRIEDKTYYAW